MARTASGFTLIELILVLLIVTIGLAGLASMFSNNSRAITIAEDTQQAAQYAQECAERVLAVRRNQGFVSVNENVCDSMSLTSTGFTRNVAISAAYPGGATAACPESATCRDVSVTVSKGASSSALTLMLVDY